MARKILILGALAGASAVILGAFGAHAMKDWLASLEDGAQRLEWWKTGVDYHFWHALLLVGLGALARDRPDADAGPLFSAAIAVCVGLLLFCGSLYAMTFTGIRVLGAITPLGGLSFILAWLLLLRAVARKGGA